MEEPNTTGQIEYTPRAERRRQRFPLSHLDLAEGSASAMQWLSRRFAVLIALAIVMAAGATYQLRYAEGADTTYLPPSANDGGWDANEDGAYANGGTAATENDGDNVVYSNFGLSIPAGATIGGIEVQADAFSSDSSGCELEVELSWNAGGNYSSVVLGNLTNAEATLTFGSSANTTAWGGHSWVAGDFSNANFRVRVQSIEDSGGCDNNATTTLDFLRVRVTYTEPAPATLNITSATFQAQSSQSGPPDAGANVVILAGTNVFTNVVVNHPAIAWESLTVQVGAETSFCSNTPNQAAGGNTAVQVTIPDANISNTAGTYNVSLTAWSSNNCTGTASSVSPFNGAITVVAPATNPAFPAQGSCGLDIALVIDLSASVSASELTSQKNALVGFVNALDTTPTNFSLIRFSTEATVGQGWTNNPATINAAINASSGNASGYTNWQQALLTAHNQFNSDPSGNFNVVIFTSDGDPTATYTGGAQELSDNPTSPGTPNAFLPYAVVEANAIKTAPNPVARIISVGIGDSASGAGPNAANLQAVSSADAYYAGSFNDLDELLETVATDLCGGSITVKKIIDTDGNPATTGDQTNGVGWSINVDGTVNSPTNDTKLTDVNGQANFAIDFTNANNPVTANITETLQAGYTLATVVCENINGGDMTPTISGGNQVSVAFDRTDIASCKFYNRPATATIIVDKVTNPAGDPQSFTFSATGQANFNLTDAAAPKQFSVTAGQQVVISEVLPSGWQSGSVSCSAPSGGTTWTTGDGTATVTPALDQVVTCVFTNNKLPKLTVNKTVVNDNGGTLSAASFPVTINGNPATWGAVNTLTPGSYTVAETNQPGYTAGNWGGDCAPGGTVTLAYGDNKTCTITNNDNAPSLTLNKVVTNDNGGTATAANFTLTATGPTGFSGVGPSVSNGASFDAGNYTLSESGPSGYTASAWSCQGGTLNGNIVTVGLGASVTCTITNTDDPGSLTLKKVVINDHGGAEDETDFTLSASGPTPFSDAGPTVNSPGNFQVGTYTLSETGPSGYSASSWVCDSGSQNGNNITVGLGQNVTCTITNNDIGPSLILNKVVVNNDGGTAMSADFTLTATGLTGFSGNGPQVVSDATFQAGTYTLSESGPAGYAASSWVCVGGTQNGSSITVGLGQDVVCTITNDDIAPSLTLHKVVINDNGGTMNASNFTLSASGGPTPFSGSGPSVGSPTDFDAGTYSLSEIGPDNYTASDWVCVGGTQNGASITLGVGQSAICTITNDDNEPRLTLNKVVTNDNGGTATPANFVLTATGATGFSGPGPSVSSGSGFDAGAYTLSESGPSGYTASAWSCDGGTLNGNVVTVPLGAIVSCTITNTDDPGFLTLNKVVTNDNGGTALTSDFTLSATGATPFSGAGPLVASPGNFQVGTYTLGETGPSGYTASAWVCVGGSQNGASITVGLGQNVVCTITNNDSPPSLTLNKLVVNDNGGTALASSFTLTADGPTDLSGAGPQVVSNSSFQAGTYALSETGPSGYTASAWVCDGGTQNGASITVGLGQSAVCTITNDDNAPSLTLNKLVVNDNGGTAAAADFTLTATGPTGFTGSGPSVSNGSSFDAGSYTLSETGPSGYTASAWSCQGGTLNGNVVAVALGASVTCTITNNDDAPSLTLVKVVVNSQDGGSSAADFTLTATGPTGISGAGPEVESDASFDAGTYTLSETGPDGYTASDWDCEGGEQDGSSVTVGLGEDVTCTITNTEDAEPLLGKVVDLDHPNVEVIADIPTVQAGATFDYIIRVLNNGAADADLTLEDFGLTGATITAISSTPDVGCTDFDPDGFVCNIFDLGADEYVDFTVTVQANDQCLPITNQARVSFYEEPAEPEGPVLAAFPDGYEDFVGVDTVQAVLVNVNGCVVDLDVAKGQRLGDDGGFTTSTLAVVPGTDVQYRIVIENDGDVTLTDVVIEDPISGDLTLTAIVSDPDNRCDIVGGDLVCDGFDLDPDESYTVIIEVEVEECDLITNRADADAFELTTQQSNAVQLNCEIGSDDDPQEPEPSPSPAPSPTSEVAGTRTQPQQPQEPRISQVLPSRLPATGTGDSIESGSSQGNYAFWGGLAMILGLLMVAVAARKLLARRG